MRGVSCARMCAEEGCVRHCEGGSWMRHPRPPTRIYGLRRTPMGMSKAPHEVMRFVPSGVLSRLATRCPRILRDGILWYAPQQRRPVRKLRGSGDDNSLLRGLGLGAGHLLLVDPSRGEWRTTWTSDCARGRPRLEERQHIAGSTADSDGPDRAGLACLGHLIRCPSRSNEKG